VSTLDDEDVEAIARRVVELIAPMLADAPSRSAADGPSPGADSQQLADWVQTRHPAIAKRLESSPAEWSATLVDAAAGTDPVDVLTWAWSENCPTSYWRERHRPVPAPTPRESRRSDPGSPRRYRHGPWLQMLAEHRLHLAGRDEDLAAVDPLIAEVARAINAAGTRNAAISLSSRKNALTIMAEPGNDPQTVLEIVRWCLSEKPHWRSNLTGVPKPTTFRAMRGDWTSAGQGFRLDSIDDIELRQHVSDLAKGWVWYLSQTVGHDTEITSRTLHRIHALLLGDDTQPAVTKTDVQETIRWICDPQSGRSRYYTDSFDFPRPDRARKALLDMRSGPPASSGVTATNSAAGDLVGDHADDELKGML